MPTFSVIAFDRFLEPTSTSSSSSSTSHGSLSSLPHDLSHKNIPPTDRKASPALISPALYTTPETTPVPDSPTSFNPSPYVINHKRRRPRVMEDVSEVGGLDLMAKGKENEGKDKNNVKNGETEGGTEGNSDGQGFVENTAEETSSNLEQSAMDASHDFVGEKLCRVNDITQSPNSVLKEEKESDNDDFVEAEDWKSVASSSDTEDMSIRSRRGLNFSPLTNRSEFYDALDDLSPEEVASQTSESYNAKLQCELDTLRSNLCIETERRKSAEEALSLMQNQWQEIAKKFSSVGLSFPATGINSSPQAEKEMKHDLIDEICERVVVARYVAGAVGRGSTRAELEQEMEATVDSKNREIARLRDKLQYYEVVNHEISQRNQEAIEVARRRRRKQKKLQRWIWTSVAVGITIGTSAIAYTYLTRAETKGCRSPCGSQTGSYGKGPDSVEM